MAFKSYGTRKRWYANPAEIDLAIKKHSVRTKSGESPLRYFDGATMASYQVPSRTVENVFCRRQPTPLSCVNDEYIYNPELSNVVVSSLEVKTSEQGENAGRGLFTKVDMPENTYIAAESTVHAVRFFPTTNELITKLFTTCEPAEKLEVPEYYMDGYGFTSQTFVSLRALSAALSKHDLSQCIFVLLLVAIKQGAPEVVVDSCIITFVNHGCRGTYNVGTETDVDEFTADPNVPIEALNGRLHHTGGCIFDPVIDRHLFRMGDVSNKDIKAGDEILENYLAFIGSEDYWAEATGDLRKQCSGEVTDGSVTEYEHYFDEEEEES